MYQNGLETFVFFFFVALIFIFCNFALFWIGLLLVGFAGSWPVVSMLNLTFLAAMSSFGFFFWITPTFLKNIVGPCSRWRLRLQFEGQIFEIGRLEISSAVFTNTWATTFARCDKDRSLVVGRFSNCQASHNASFHGRYFKLKDAHSKAGSALYMALVCGLLQCW